MREALRQLEGRGLVEADDAGGMHVVRLDGEEVAESLQARAVLEALSSGAAARRHGAGDVDDRALAELIRLAGAADVYGDRGFHLAISRLAGNRPVHDALSRTWDRLVVGARQPDPWAQELESQARRGRDEHLELAGAIASGDDERASATASRHALAEAQLLSSR